MRENVYFYEKNIYIYLTKWRVFIDFDDLKITDIKIELLVALSQITLIYLFSFLGELSKISEEQSKL